MTATHQTGAGHTPLQRLRVPADMWAAFGTVCGRLDQDRTTRLLEHIRADIREHGTPEELAQLEAAERELAARRARMHPGRPRKTDPR